MVVFVSVSAEERLKRGKKAGDTQRARSGMQHTNRAGRRRKKRSCFKRSGLAANACVCVCTRSCNCCD